MSIEDTYRRFLKLTDGDAVAAAILAVGVCVGGNSEPRNNLDGVSDELLTAEEVAETLKTSVKSVRRLDQDRSQQRTFPQPVLIPSPSGRHPIKRWRLSDVSDFLSFRNS